MFNENIDQFCIWRKKSYLYLMKIQISFGFREKIRSENIDQF